MQLAPFTTVQTNYLKRSAKNWLNVIEGGKRGAKNVTNVMAWCAALEYHKNRLHLAAGVSVASAKLNIIDCDGFGVLYYFAGRYREGKYKDRDCVYVQTKTGRKIILISGGGKKGDEKLIKGNTYGTALITEINECHPDFIQEVFDRTLSSANRKIFADFNPKDQAHWFYTDILNFHEEQQGHNRRYGYNYAHTTIANNLSITDAQLRNILKSYDKSTVWYRRDIKGERAAAEGLIFPQYADNPGHWRLEKAQENYAQLYIGVDFGGTRSKTVFVLAGICGTAAAPQVHILDAHKVKDNGHGVDGVQIAREYAAFFKKAAQVYGKAPVFTFTDHLEALRLQMKKAVEEYEHKVVFVDKSISLSEWCKTLNAMFNLDILKILKGNEIVEIMLKSLVYDEKADDERPVDDGITCDVDCYDAMRYAMSKITRDWLKRGIIWQQ